MYFLLIYNLEYKVTNIDGVQCFLYCRRAVSLLFGNIQEKVGSTPLVLEKKSLKTEQRRL